jgi:hypothetical protein
MTNCPAYVEIAFLVVVEGCRKKAGRSHWELSNRLKSPAACRESTATEERESKSRPNFTATRSSHTELRGGEAPDRNRARGKDKPRNHFANFENTPYGRIIEP